MKHLFSNKSWHSIVATISGAVVAIATAWMTIDWSNFNIAKEWPKLVLSAIIALGGFITQIKPKQDG